jgi:hypothetical protein
MVTSGLEIFKILRLLNQVRLNLKLKRWILMLTKRTKKKMKRKRHLLLKSTIVGTSAHQGNLVFFTIKNSRYRHLLETHAARKTHLSQTNS